MLGIDQLLDHPLEAFGWLSAVIILEFIGMVVYRGVKTGDWRFMDD